MSTNHCKIAWSCSKKAGWLKHILYIASWRCWLADAETRLPGTSQTSIAGGGSFRVQWSVAHGEGAHGSMFMRSTSSSPSQHFLKHGLRLLPSRTQDSTKISMCPCWERMREGLWHMEENAQTYRHIRSYKGNRINRSNRINFVFTWTIAHLTSPPTFTFASAQALRTPRACLK